MYSGSDSNESQKYANWALNPASFQSVPGEQVDWAALAQQWIIMKEAGPPPIPGEQPVLLGKKKTSQEGGEAEMEVENEKEAPPPPVWGNKEPSAPSGADAWNWGNQNQNWNNWNNSWAPPTAVPPPAPNISSVKAPLLPTPNNAYSEPPESTSDNAVPFGNYNSNSNEYNSTSPKYWNNSGAPPKHIKPHNKRYSKVNVPIRAPGPLPAAGLPAESISSTMPTPTLDTAKRKQLPAWIREGLEKMEKEKMKQMEKQREKEERESYMEPNKISNQDTIEILKSTMKERQKSRFESDGENSDEDKKKRKRRKSAEPTPLTHEELMLKVRRTMTEILLNVTNRQIEAVCKEELQRFVKNRKASEAASAPSGANIRGRLGLGMYGGEDSGSSSDDDKDDHRDSRDSDDELKDAIKRKMADFQKTEREIEDKLEEAERRKGGGGSVSRPSTPESNDNDSQVDARNQGRKYYQHDTRQPSPPKTTHESKSKRSPSSSSQDSDYSHNRSKTSRQSSSSDSKDSYKKSSKRRSITPDKRHRSTSSRWSKSPSRRSNSRRDSKASRKKSSSSKRSRSRSYSRSRRSRSSSYKKSRRSRSRERSKRSRSSSRSRYSSRRSPSSSRSDRRRRRKSRSDSSGRGKRSHRH